MCLIVNILNGSALSAHTFSFINIKVLFMYQMLIGFTSSYMCATYVTLAAGVLIEIVIQLCLLEKSLKDMEDYMDLKSCIYCHVEILTFIKKIQKFYEVGVSAVFIGGVFNICTTMSLVIESAKISYAIFSSKWINADVAYKRLIQIYIQLTSRPLAIRLGGGTFDASLPVFVTVIKTAYSVFTLLQGFEDY
ncbi:unnamed protein product [Acanthoscelides obtectus]|uniref:Uncharacterized protein n=1 Tax=Acanthoscelides obtectus TaxID=200917 RepID=A0A9P0PAI9_ACAOB|nr:unnamed protein product [Acanthoscelides obtectus]CAK1632509.1 hypothetical protein AOBTE_LOCUS7605 [Acanthoscelides obtectus]